MKSKSGSKIVFVNQATGYLTIDIINAFAAHFGEVALIAGSIRVQDVPLDPKVKWSKIVPYDRGNAWGKLISWFFGTVQIFFLLLFKYRNYEIFYMTIPPLAYLGSLLLPNKFAVLAWDVYPDALKTHDVKEANFIYKLWAHGNREVFKKARRIFTVSEGMADLLAMYMPKKKVKIIPLWTGLTRIRPVQKQENSWLKKLGLEAEFIVQYSGNMGSTHNVEILVELAQQLQGEKGIHFLIIGRGEKVDNVRTLIRKRALTNCTLLPFQPDEALNDSLSAADLGVVLLDEKTAHVSLPSKIYNLQALAVPILGISPLNSELDKHLKNYGNGRCFQQSDREGMIRFILEMKDYPGERLKLAENSKKAAQFYTMNNARKYYQAYVS